MPKIIPKPYQRHPWEHWFRSKEFVLLKGTDYGCADHGMAQAVRNKAAKLGLRVSLDVTQGRVAVTVIGPQPKKEKPCRRSPVVKFPKLK